jgi:hypothetical protein
MDIKRNVSQHSAKAPAECFTGTVRIDELFTAPGPAHGSRRAQRVIKVRTT